MPPNIYDIARAANVSIATVSHALSGRGRVAEATRERVRQTASELGYAANPHARSLVSGRSRMVAMQIAGFTEGGASKALLPDAAYYMDVLNGAASAAAEHDHALVLIPHSLEPVKVRSLAVDGAIIVDPTGGDELTAELVALGIPVVTTGRPTGGPFEFPWVDNNHAETARRMLDHLLAMGYTRPALISTPPTVSYVADIYNAFVRWSFDHGLQPRTVEVPEPPTEKSGARVARRLLSAKDPPDAVYTSYDRLAVGVLAEAQRQGIEVPGELGIASAVDGDLLRWINPTITSVALNARRIGSEAVERLITLLTEDQPSQAGVVIPARIVERASTRRVGK
ncbi:MAG TPA: LacI family DNA-binding transcriptional regulator [Solirubrobacteraceae bacterium]|jgi:DNA-binding LacI/PurR family transcriptional regulator|nr:LacI family DNA-binding transcriptional regulator [Solirubrobacteraceae bacterium]